MEDSGIDSDPKMFSNNCGDILMQLSQRLHEFVGSEIRRGKKRRSGSWFRLTLPKFGSFIPTQDGLSDSSSSSDDNIEVFLQSNVKQLQRKLEQRIQDVKKIQKSQQQDQKKSNLGPNLIPIQRLSIPNKPMNITTEEHVPLVFPLEFEDSDEAVSLFPEKLLVKHELTDTFSIEEFQITPDEDDEDDLNLLPPEPTYQRISLCCFTVHPKCVIQ